MSAAAKREQNWAYIMVAPTIIGLLVLNLWPFVQTLYTSFCEHLGFGHYKFVGLQNYIDIFQRPEFWKATWNTIYFCILTVPIGLFLSLLVAMLLNAKIKGKGAFRTIFFLPMVCAPAAVTMVWRWIFNGEYGILNQAMGTHIRLDHRPQRGHDRLRRGGHLVQHRLRRRAAPGGPSEHLQVLLRGGQHRRRQ